MQRRARSRAVGLQAHQPYVVLLIRPEPRWEKHCPSSQTRRCICLRISLVNIFKSPYCACNCEVMLISNVTACQTRAPSLSPTPHLSCLFSFVCSHLFQIVLKVILCVNYKGGKGESQTTEGHVSLQHSDALYQYHMHFTQLSHEDARNTEKVRLLPWQHSK